ncbi:hypothetical protein J6590_044385 [Homalodisca vitripennis]|nr:hypothetical protein J6590_044385 [Homalodisca vitripennis]
MRILSNKPRVFQLYKQLVRELHLSRACRLNINKVTEVRIPVPWGHIAGKWWGDTSKQPILALHGWQDNAGTFDPLFELLPESTPILAIDSPGHGFSSHYPEAMLYHNANYIIVCQRVKKYFKWEEKLNFLAHSEGGVIAFLYSSIYPEFVNSLITLDVIKPFASEDGEMIKLGKYIDTSVTKSRRDPSENPKYSIEEIQDRWLKGSRGSLTLDAVNILMRRGVMFHQESGKYTLTRDPKVKIHSLQRLDENQSLEMARNLKCHYLVLRTTEGKFFDYSLKNSPGFINTVTESAKSFKLVNVEGPHHVHLTNPERVAPIIIEFYRNIKL